MKFSAVWIQWHRRIGLIVAPVLMVLAITGVLINHSQSLGWHHKPVYSTLLAWIYGIPVRPVTTGYPVPGKNSTDWLYQMGEEIYLTHSLIVTCSKSVSGVVNRTDAMVVLCGQKLNYLTHEGELIEELTVSSLPIDSIGLQQDRLIGKGNGSVFLFDENKMDWVPAPAGLVQQKVDWSEAEPLPAALLKSVNDRIPVSGLNQERVLLDLHSGRLFGDIGVWVVDASGVVLLFLVLSGTTTWFFRSLRRRKR